MKPQSQDKVLRSFFEIVTNVLDTSRKSGIISHQTEPNKTIHVMAWQFFSNCGSGARSRTVSVEIIAVAVLYLYQPHGFISPVETHRLNYGIGLL